MSTRSSILIKTDAGYRGIYCHSGGEPEVNGAILHEHYQDPEKIKALIELGAISTLGYRVRPIGLHSEDHPEPGTTVAYIRDWGRDPEENAAEDLTSIDGSQYAHIEYAYVYESDQWTVFDFTDITETRIMLLSEALEALSSAAQKPQFARSILPAWANKAIAMDQCGTWHCYSDIPEASGDSRYEWLSDNDDWEAIHPSYYPEWEGDWKDSLVVWEDEAKST